MDYLKRYEFWLTSEIFDENTKNELKLLKGDNEEIKERFYKNLEFGTGGIRGIIGAGDNKINIYTVRKTTQGLSNYILKSGTDTLEKGVAIAYDSRKMSKEFATETALCLAANGIKVYIFPDLRPTPMLSFAVRELGCIAGVVITASHNPPQYNGYKVYWQDGGQLTDPNDKNVITEVNNISEYDKAKTISIEEATSLGLYNIISKEVDDAYTNKVLDEIVDKNIIDEMGDKLKIIYTPIHGSGNIPVRRALKEAGFTNFQIVKEQEMPDENFTTVGYPNPEDPKVFNLAIKLAEKEGADLIIGTDPDCDRLGAVCKNSAGEFKVLSGNMIGCLILEYILSQKKDNKNNEAVVSTIVSSDLAKEICKFYNIKYFETLTGFKYIGEKIKEFEESNEFEYIFGFEESNGCLSGTYARDKDAVNATLLLCEVAAYYKKRNMTLLDGLNEIYTKFGFYKDNIISIETKGINGTKIINTIMSNLRKEKIENVNNSKVIEILDYESGKSYDFVNDMDMNLDLPKSNVLLYKLEDKTWFCVRPSGTEPKIKIYFGVCAMTDEDSTHKSKEVENCILDLIEVCKKEN